ncbi:glycerophosphoryl diester phosphodiesterase [Anaeramoeba flamelloides]|uniref:Glycerophosphoryl diester phosphodiesterase n=1 Tax=Anaeramoeba flamelloides TaxID=1746091 RepID=A0AAV7Y8J8_9EUKA|nr:glycerophosphoryl diester phosphodiesterase [Anaeramoeba flamelloides]
MSEEILIPTNFSVITDFLSTESTVCVLGNCKELGNWDIVRSVELTRQVYSQNNEQQIWNVTIHLPLLQEVEYKYVIKENGFLSCWETFPVNRKLDVSKNKQEIIEEEKVKVKVKVKENENEKGKGKVKVNKKEQEQEQEQKQEHEQTVISKFGKYQQNYRDKWVDSDLLVDEMLIILQMDLEGEEKIPGIYLDAEVIPEAAINNTKEENRSQFSVKISKRKSKKTQKGSEKERKQDLLKWESYSVVDTEIYRHKCPVHNKDTFDLTILYKDQEMIARTTLTNNSIKNNSGQVVLPLFDTTHELVGEVTLRYYKIMPFLGKRKKHNNLSNIFRTYWSPKKDQVYIGHRGSGSNKGWSRVQENSILSFQLAQNSKVSDWIEFDVQITKDQKIVVYHDFHVTIKQESNILKIPICKMTEKEFFSHRNDGLRSKRENNYQKKLNKIKQSKYENLKMKAQSRRVTKTPNTNRKKQKGENQVAECNENTLDNPQKNRLLTKSTYIKSKSSTDLASLTTGKPRKIEKKKKKTQENLLKKHFKLQKTLITDRFINLDHIFQQLNDDLNFNIEIKYPYTFTSEKELNYPDRNAVVDKTLEIVLKYSKGKTPKRIIFSSFDPIICLMVHWKQPKFPVFFLNDGGSELYENPLMNSLEHALHFSSKSKFKGIVCHTEPLLTNKKFVQEVHNHNLVLFTYGDHNNDKNYLQIQKNLKVDGIIGDKVSKINLKSVNK